MILLGYNLRLAAAYVFEKRSRELKVHNNSCTRVEDGLPSKNLIGERNG